MEAAPTKIYGANAEALASPDNSSGLTGMVQATD
jgi:hypothetical protein